MAEVKKKLKKLRRRSAAKSNKEPRLRKKPAARERNVPAENTPVADGGAGAESSGAVNSNVEGAEQLRRSVNQEVAAEADNIAKGLAQKAAKGSAACAKILWDVMNGKKQAGERNSTRSSGTIGRLEMESEWVGPETNSAMQTEDSSA